MTEKKGNTSDVPAFHRMHITHAGQKGYFIVNTEIETARYRLYLCLLKSHVTKQFIWQNPINSQDENPMLPLLPPVAVTVAVLPVEGLCFLPPTRGSVLDCVFWCIKDNEAEILTSD